MTTTTDYNQQTADFLTKSGVKFTAKFIKHDFHFAGDKAQRDIFKVSFSRGKQRFSLNFGQSINDSTGNGDNLPTAYDVLYCIQKSEIGTFENFCGDFGYDTDSRQAFKTYKAVEKEFNKVSKFFTESELDELTEIQ